MEDVKPLDPTTSGGDMLEMTRGAKAVVRTITDHPRLGQGSGLRIGRPTDGAPIQVCAVTGPRAGDDVTEQDGARTFLGPAAARRLRGRVLDVGKDRDGRFRFIVRESV
jgi:iron-sulfur cluster assembly protein